MTGKTSAECPQSNEAVPWIVRTGSSWRDLPEVFGDWNSVLRRFSRWSHKLLKIQAVPSCRNTLRENRKHYLAVVTLVVTILRLG